MLAPDSEVELGMDSLNFFNFRATTLLPIMKYFEATTLLPESGLSVFCGLS